MTIRDLHYGRRWQLPDGVEEILPPRAARIEAVRRRVLDEFELWGYALVDPPLIEYLDSLLVAAGSDLDLQTFKVTDQLSGRMMGVRADITSQAARIDAHSLASEGPTRLCYAGTVLRTRPEGLLGSRAPIRIGAELYGVPGPAGDAEAVALLLRMLEVAGIGAEAPVQLELGHVAFYRILARAAALPTSLEAELFSAIQRKATADVSAVLSESGCRPDVAEVLRALPGLFGDASTLARARALFAGLPGAVAEELAHGIDELEAVAERVAERVPGVAVRFDVAELRGYHYHTGVLFSAYAADHARAIAGGGRYDGVGGAFGRARPATGFDADLKVLADLGAVDAPARRTILAPADVPSERAEALWATVRQLRASGVRVVPEPAAETGGERLEWREGAWVPVADTDN